MEEERKSQSYSVYVESLRKGFGQLSTDISGSCFFIITKFFTHDLKASLLTFANIFFPVPGGPQNSILLYGTLFFFVFAVDLLTSRSFFSRLGCNEKIFDKHITGKIATAYDESTLNPSYF